MKPCMNDPLAMDGTSDARTARCLGCGSTECGLRLAPMLAAPVLPAPAFLRVPPPASALNVQVAGGHYKSMRIQPVEFITANNLTFLEGCVIKRVCRHRAKNGAEDIRKAIHELQLLLELEYPASVTPHD